MGHCKDCQHWGKPGFLDEERNGITFRACGAVQEAPETPASKSFAPEIYAKELAAKRAFDRILTSKWFYVDDVERSGCSTLRTGPDFGCVNFEKKEDAEAGPPTYEGE